MAELSALTLPIFTEYDGKRIELGAIEVPISVTIGKRYGSTLRTHITVGGED